VQSFVPGETASGARFKISAGGGSEPRWRGDGRELFYLSPDRQMKAASVTAGGTSFQTGPPTTLFSTKVPTTPSASLHYDVTRDGERFILLESVEEITKPMTLVINWLAAREVNSFPAKK
jgi:eukaryotic-like serine/threonine-protein kinase